MTRTEIWAAKNGITREQLAKAGMLPEQIRARYAQDAAVLAKHGMAGTPIHRELVRASK